MKKILFVCTFVLIAVSGFIFYYYSAFLNSRSWESWGESAYAVKFYLTEDMVENNQKLGDELIQNADEHGVNIIKTSYISKQNESSIKKGIYMCQSADRELLLLLTHGQTFDLRNLEGEQSLSTQAGEYQVFDQFADDYVEFMTLSALWQLYGGKGEYMAIPSSDSQGQNTGEVDTFIDELCSNLGISRDQLTTKTSFEAISMNSMVYIFTVLFILVFLFFVFANVLYTVKASKNIGIQLLNGYAASSIWWELIRPILCGSVLMLVEIDLLIGILVRPYYPKFIIALVGIHLGVIAMIVLSSLLSYAYIKSQRLNELIKGRKRIKGITELSKLVQLAFVSCGIIIIMAIAGSNHELITIGKQLKKWLPYQSFKVLEHMSVGDDLDPMTGETKNLEMDCANLYDVFNENGALYFSTKKLSASSLTKYDPETGARQFRDYVPQKLRENLISLELVSANVNYLNTYPLYDEEGNKISIDNESSDTIILLPNNNSYDAELVEDLIVAFNRSENDAIKSKYGEQYAKESTTESTQIIYYDPQVSLFDLNIEENETERNLSNPVIKVLTNQNISFFDKAKTQLLGLKSPIKLPESMGEEQLEQILLENHLDDNRFRYVSIGTYFANKQYVLQQQISILAVIYLILFLLSIFIASQEAALYFESRKKLLTVKTTFGYSYLERHKWRMMVDVSVILVSVIAGIILIRPELNSMNLIMIVVFIMINVMTQMFISKELREKWSIPCLRGRKNGEADRTESYCQGVWCT